MKVLFKLFKAIGKLINVTRLIIINGVFLVLLLLFFVVLGSEEQPLIIAENSTLQLNLNGRIVEQRQALDFSQQLSKQLTSDEQQPREYPLDELVQVINHAAVDENIRGILLDIGGLQGASINHINTLGRAINAFRARGKEVIATADHYSQTQYLLASYADKIYLDPQGMVFLQGFSVYRLYFKELLDNLLITPHIFKVGKFKSFVEPFTDSAMSADSKRANAHWLNQLWQDYIETVVDQRSNTNISPQSISPTLAQLKTGLLQAKGDSALYAQQVGLVDALLPRQQVLQLGKQNNAHYVRYAQYQSTLPALYSEQSAPAVIALIHGQGEIVAGRQNSNMIGGESFSALLHAALKNDRVKAVVIRLDTPGGSAFASEKIRQQILALKKADKKVVVSMGSVAASGGYWIASAADHIVASPSTLTGSIGIFGLFASADKALNKLGIYNDGVATTPLAGLDPSRPLDSELAEIIQIGIERGYQQFLSVVSEGRGMSMSDVEKVAQGRVWTGTDALRLGLVDQLGDLNSAVEHAGQLASLEDYQILPFVKPVSTKNKLLNELFNESIHIVPQGVLNSPLLSTVQQVAEQTALLGQFNDPKGHYAFCAMCFIEQ